MKIPFNLTGKFGLLNPKKESLSMDVLSWNIQGNSISNWSGSLEIDAKNQNIIMSKFDEDIYLQLDAESALFSGNITIDKITTANNGKNSFICEFIGKGDLAEIPLKFFHK